MAKKKQQKSLVPIKIDFSYPYYFLLLAVYPIIFLYTNNLEEVYLEQILPPLVLSLTVSVFTFLILVFFLKSRQKAALITSLLFVVFFSYGHVFSIVDGLKILGLQVGRNKFLLPLSLTLIIVVSLFILRTKVKLENITKGLNVALVALLLLAALNFILFSLENGVRIKEEQDANQPFSSTKNGKDKPDIYYIILDGYTRADILQTVHKFDNSEFIDFLKNKGFYVVDKSRSNYSLSLLSLSSSLNMRYLDDLAQKDISETKKRDLGIEMIRHNKVAKLLRSKGYKIINIGTGWGATDKNPYADSVHHYRQRSEFTKIIFQTTMLVALERFQLGDADSILFAFEKLKQITEDEEPTFTFAHIVSPHPPYLFDRSGRKLKNYSKSFNEAGSWEQRDKYIDQLIFINKKTIDVVETILTKSTFDPIIIIQGDHGTGSLGSTDLEKVSLDKLNERISNLNVYYFPNGGDKTLYETITPVNSFRKMFNFYFDSRYKILEDKSFYSQYRKYFEFRLVPKKSL
ncbi:MAG: sulfatase-like hydrolase/transferase [Candidatus Woykebacteria bacterium]